MHECESISSLTLRMAKGCEASVCNSLSSLFFQKKNHYMITNRVEDLHEGLPTRLLDFITLCR